MLKTFVIGGAAALLVAAPAIAQQAQRDEARSGRAAQTSTTNTQGQSKANENAGFTQTGGGQSGGGMSGDHRGHNMSGGETGGQTGGQLTEGMQIVDGSGKVIGVIVQIQRTRDGDIRMIKARFDGFGRVMVKLVPKFQLKVQGTQALTQLVQAEIEKLQNAPA